MKQAFTLAAFFMLLTSYGTQAQDFTYEPKNPAFGGGNAFNYSWLLSSASAQNGTTDPNARQPSTQAVNPLADFTQSLNRQLLSQLTSRFITAQFGAGPIQQGSYTVGGYQIQVTPGADGVVLQITDPLTGNQTTVTIPNVP